MNADVQAQVDRVKALFPEDAIRLAVRCCETGVDPEQTVVHYYSPPVARGCPPVVGIVVGWRRRINPDDGRSGSICATLDELAAWDDQKAADVLRTRFVWMTEEFRKKVAAESAPGGGP